jgi:choline dehydrogenase
MLTSPAAHALAMMRSEPGLAEPDLQLFFSPMLLTQSRGPSERSFASFSDRPGIRMSAYVCRPTSKGRLRLDPLNRGSSPIIEPRLLADPGDMAALIGALRLIERLAEAPGLAQYVVGNPDPLPDENADLADYIRNMVGIGYHPVGTCRMAGGTGGVVDPQLRVKGVDGLRVVDASIMPTLVSANTLAAVLMIGEKGAEMISKR